MFEMSEEQAKLFEKLTALQKEIALNNIAGMSDIDAYKKSKGKAKKESTMRASVCEILANPNVEAFIKSMANHIVNPAIMSRERMMELQTKLAESIALSSAEITLGTASEFKGAFDIQLKAMKQLADLAGYNEAQKIEHSGSTKVTTIDLTASPEDAARMYAEMMEGK